MFVPEGAMMHFNCSNRELMDLVLASEYDMEKCIAAVKSLNPQINSAHLEEIKRYLCQTFVPHFRKRWQDARCNKSYFCDKYKN